MPKHMCWTMCFRLLSPGPETHFMLMYIFFLIMDYLKSLKWDLCKGRRLTITDVYVHDHSFWTTDLGSVKLDGFSSNISHLPGSFCPWIFFYHVVLNTLPLGYLMSNLYYDLWYPPGAFHAFQLIVLVVLGVINHSLASGNLVLNLKDNGSVSLTRWNTLSMFFYSVLHIFTCILISCKALILLLYLLFALFSCLKIVLDFCQVPLYSFSIEVVRTSVCSSWDFYRRTCYWPPYFGIISFAKLSVGVNGIP